MRVDLISVSAIKAGGAKPTVRVSSCTASARLFPFPVQMLSDLKTLDLQAAKVLANLTFHPSRVLFSPVMWSVPPSASSTWQQPLLLFSVPVVLSLQNAENGIIQHEAFESAFFDLT